MKVHSEEKYRSQPNLKVFRLKIDDTDDMNELKRLHMMQYDKFKDKVAVIVGKVFEDQRVVVDSVDFGERIVIVSVWKR